MWREEVQEREDVCICMLIHGVVQQKLNIVKQLYFNFKKQIFKNHDKIPQLD